MDNNAAAAPSYAEEAKQTGLDERFIGMVRSELKAIAAYDVRETKRTLEKPMVLKAINGQISDEMIALASAALTLGFAGRDITSEGILKLLNAAGIKHSLIVDAFLNIINIINSKNHHAYLFATYSLMFLNKEPNTNNVLRLIRVLGISTPDANFINEMILFCKEYEAGSIKPENAESISDPNIKAIFKRFSGVIIDVYDTISDFTIKETSTAIREKGLGQVSPDLYPYIWALTTLSVSGRDTDIGSIEGFIDAARMNPSKKQLDMIAYLHIRNQLIYLVSLYYLLAIGIGPSIDNLLKVVKALGLYPDALVAKKIVTYYNSKQPSEGFKVAT